MSGEIRTVLLAGNPNVGKSTVFNALTGLKQHTGNWPGKTVETAEGRYTYRGREYRLVDLPGTYSLDARSGEEQVAREALEGGDFDCVAVVCDGTLLRRNLILVYQILALHVPVVVCVNLLDEASRRGMEVDCPKLSRLLGVPVVAAAAGRSQGLSELQQEIELVSEGFHRPHPPEIPVSRQKKADLAEETAAAVTCVQSEQKCTVSAWDRLLTGRRTGIPIMLLLLFFLLWLTIAGANVPSDLLWQGVLWLYDRLTPLLSILPWYLREALLDGVLLTVGRVIAVMLPPMAIFFPMFTLLEDLGYLPRVAYNLDRSFERCGGCGKMALSMCMGLGCNAAGVVGCRIIDSPRERKLAVATNSFIPCNGRFGALIFLLTAFLVPGNSSSGLAALGLTGFLVLGVVMTLVVCKILSVTILRGVPSSFALELPPFRVPRVGQVIVRSVLDRTIRVLGRAVTVAAPAGLLLWILSTVTVGGQNLLGYLTNFLDPLGRILGMSGVILGAFLLGFPANEIVLPIVVLAVTGAFQLDAGNAELASALQSVGFGWEMALCTAVFFLFHWPCATTCLTIRRETGSTKWMLFSMALPTVVGMALCLTIHLICSLI